MKNIMAEFDIIRYSIMKCCWEEQPQDRPTFSELLEDISKCLIFMTEYVPMQKAN